MAPADLKKEGVAYDLPIAIGVLGASEQINNEYLDQYIMMGELSLDGTLQPIKGALPIAILAREKGFKGILLPKHNAMEAAIVGDINVFGFNNINEVRQVTNDPSKFSPTKINTRDQFFDSVDNPDFDFSDEKRLTGASYEEIAAAGGGILSNWTSWFWKNDVSKKVLFNSAAHDFA